MHFFSSLLLAIAISALSLSVNYAWSAEPASRGSVHSQAAVALYEGKLALDSGQYERAIEQLTVARERLPLLADYILYWRAQAFLAANDFKRTADDIQTLRELSRKGLFARPCRLLELELAEREKSGILDNLYQRYLKDYPSDMQIKLAYARYLKKTGSTDRATRMLRELFTTVTPSAKAAEAELNPDDITAEDWLKKARNLNSGWLFADAEQAFREAIRRNSRLRSSSLDGLAYSLFRQKRYTEAAETYAMTGNAYWHARSLLRANNLDAFETRIPTLLKSREGRTGSLLLAYASKKRRAGDLETALKTYQRVAGNYSSEREEAFWLTGWSYYRKQDFSQASETFTKLHAQFGGFKYLYWKNRSTERLNPAEAVHLSGTSMGTRDFYGYLAAVRQGLPFPGVVSSPPSERVLKADRAELLAALGFRHEAAQELKYLADKSSAPSVLVALSEHMKQVGDFRNAVRTALRVPYSQAIHDLHYPVAYWPEIENASKKNGLDAYLLLAIIREESRFDTDARSIAGALGLMQIMPQTAQRIAQGSNIPYAGPESLHLPRTNIMIGATYLKSLISEFGSIPYAIAAYNAGEEVVRSWVREGNYATVDEFIEDIPYYETQNYVKKVLTSYFQYLRVQNVTTTGNIQRQLGRL